VTFIYGRITIQKDLRFYHFFLEGNFRSYHSSGDIYNDGTGIKERDGKPVAIRCVLNI